MKTTLLQGWGRTGRIERTRGGAHAALAVGLLVAALGASCGGGPFRTRLRVEGSAGLNPTLAAEPSAVNIRVFQLIDREPFDQAQVSDLMATPPTLPAGCWVSPVIEETVYVGRAQKIPLEIKKEKVRFVGVVGVFNEFTAASRAVTKVGEVDDLLFYFDEYAIRTLTSSQRRKLEEQAAASAPPESESMAPEPVEPEVPTGSHAGTTVEAPSAGGTNPTGGRAGHGRQGTRR